MKITTSHKNVKIDNNGYINNFALDQLAVIYGPSRDSITFKGHKGYSICSPIDDIKINGNQLTNDNIEVLLEDLFQSQENTGSSGSSGNSGGSKITYLKQDDIFPAGRLNDQIIITSSGSESGEWIKGYRHDGFRWVIDGVKTNLELMYSDSSSNIVILPETKRRYYLDKGEAFFYKKNSDNTPIELRIENTGDIIELYDNDDYIVKSLNCSITKDTSFIGTLQNGASLYVHNLNNADINVEVRDCTLSNISFDGEFKRIIIDNIDKLAEEYLPYSTTKKVEYLSISNFKGLSNFDYRIYDPSINEGISSIRLKYIIMEQDARFNISGNQGYDILGKFDLEIKSIEGIDNLTLSHLDITKMLVEDINSSSINYIDIHNCNFPDQESLDNLLNVIYDGGMKEGNIQLYQINVTPNTDILQKLEDRGIEVYHG